MQDFPSGQQGHQQPFNSAFNSNQQKNLPNSTAVLVLGICSIVSCLCYFLAGVPGIVCGIIALVLGQKDLKRYKAAVTEYSVSSYNNLKAGRICAIIGLSLCALWFLFFVVIIILALTGNINEYEYHRYYSNPF